MGGVKFKEFDELGLPKDDGFDYYQYITTDTNELDNVIEASPEQMELAFHPKGERFDRDKEEDEMNEEGTSLVIIDSSLTCSISYFREGSVRGARGQR